MQQDITRLGEMKYEHGCTDGSRTASTIKKFNGVEKLENGGNSHAFASYTGSLVVSSIFCFGSHSGQSFLN